MLSIISEKIRILKDYNRIARIDRIARRYFVMNSFDGVLAIMGILIGSLIAGAGRETVLKTSIAAGIAMAVSGVWGAYLTERAERQKELHDLEKATLSKLGKTQIGRAANAAVIIIAIIDGVAPLISALAVISPFFLMQKIVPLQSLYYISVGIGFFLLFTLGIFLGRLSKESIIKTGIIMLLAGVVSLALNYLLLGGAHVA